MRLGLSSLLLLSAFLLPAAAHADSNVYTFTLNGGGDNYVFTVDNTDGPDITDGPPATYDIYFISAVDTLNPPSDPFPTGFYITDGDIVFGELPLYGDTLGTIMTGSYDTPTFVPGTYNFQDISDDPYTLTIADAPSSATPEPSSLALLGTGILGMFGVARRRFVA